jgi:hypothetical protein
MRVEELHEPVKVRADFQGGKIRPLLFRRGEKIFSVRRVNTSWEDREGTHKNFYFAVSVGTPEVYQLCLKSGDMVWYLESVMMEG